jgi:hypothetical protein
VVGSRTAGASKQPRSTQNANADIRQPSPLDADIEPFPRGFQEELKPVGQTDGVLDGEPRAMLGAVSNPAVDDAALGKYDLTGKKDAPSRFTTLVFHARSPPAAIIMASDKHFALITFGA